ncbi:MAG: extracellular solute-binding protein [Lysobacteraceae bacterium]|jgi:multiple sugar transport system substrate-binding protein
MKKSLSLVLCVILLFTAFSSLSAQGKADKGSGKIEIDFWNGWNGSDLAAAKAMVDEFNNSQDNIHVNFYSYLWSDLFTKLITEYASGEPADLICVHPFEIGQFADMGLYDAKQVEMLNLNKDDYYEAVWDGTFYKGIQYAVPFDTHMHGLFYNKEIFERSGITKAPSTGVELIDVAIALTIDKNGKHPNEAGFDRNNIVQYGLSFGMNHHAIFQWATLMYQQGVVPFTEDMTSMTFDIKKAQTAFQWIQDLIFKYQVAPQGETSYSDSFVNGKAAMVFGGSWDVPKFDNAQLNYGTVPYPQVFNEGYGYWAAAHIFLFPANKNPDSAKQEATRTFVTWLIDNSNIWVDSGYLTTKLSTWDYVASKENIAMWLDVLDGARYMPGHPLASTLFSQVAPSAFVTAYSSMILEQGDCEKGTAKFVSDLNDVLRK